jgi:hypothetical protein
VKWDNNVQKLVNEKVTATIPHNAWNSTVSIVLARNGIVEQFATGVLFRIGDQHWIVTAGHAIRTAIDENRSIGISTATGRFVVARSQWMVTTGNQYCCAEDPFDVAVCALTPEEVKNFSGNCFLSLENVEFNDQSATSVYTLFGFPTAWSVPSVGQSTPVQSKGLQYTAFAFDEETNTFPDYQSRFHILIDANQSYLTTVDGNRTSFVDVQGQPLEFPKSLHGLSGCGVWRVGDLDVPIKDWRTEEAKLAALETGAFGEKAIVATRWVAVTTLIHSAYPNCRSVIEEWQDNMN